ncbi:hypothetical protein ACFQ0M_45765 [Kitasatospora aburaviensis]|uniref:Uncharacterized protein n=1 Tax=Kitasatospora aburaviensis TaxID=67265 RepID=A0ABW1F5S7_9ACTN
MADLPLPARRRPGPAIGDAGTVLTPMSAAGGDDESRDVCLAPYNLD